jgi:hypothetical protein
VKVALDEKLATKPLLLWPLARRTLGDTLTALVGPRSIIKPSADNDDGDHSILFGNAIPTRGSLRATFDGWIAKVTPAENADRLPEREYCSLAGILAGSLAVSELFLSFAEINIEASKRIVAFSLWEPNADDCDPSALGVPVQFLPRELWVLGLGHLGNAYLWCLATLPYPNTKEIEVLLNDFDKVEPENIETCLLYSSEHLGLYKTRVCSAWLEERGFRTRLVERRFDGTFRCRADEPRLAFCGFDSNEARRNLATAEFLRVVESGLGATPNNFDTIGIHALPNPRPAEELWPDLTADEEAKRNERQRLLSHDPAYSGLSNDECGRYELAGKSIAVPFVGSVAATFVLAESIRLLHRGPAFSDIKLSLSALAKRALRSSGNYEASDFAGLKYSDSTRLVNQAA